MKTNDELRATYKRADFVKLERGKFFEEVVLGATDATARVSAR